MIEALRVKLRKKIALTVVLLACLAQPAAAEFNFENGNAAIEVVIQTVAPVIPTDVSPTGGDATLVLRVTTLITNAWFDAIAPYHPTAVGVYTRLGRRPAGESANNENMNIALLHASFHVLNSLLPQQSERWRNMLSDVGLNPDDLSTDLTTPVGIGNVAGAGVVMGRENDGMNQLGNEGGRTFNPMPYMDYTGYEPVNTAYQLLDPSSWQPDLQRQGMGLYKIQQFVTPQYGLVEPYSYTNLNPYKVPPPNESNHHNSGAYQAQADVVLTASANLTDEKKMKAELFDNKIEALGFSAVFAALSQGLSLVEFVQVDFLTNMAAFDAGIAIWSEKKRHDAVRPFSAIRYIYEDEPVTAWGGVGQGTVSLPASEWKSYLEEADHPEYPSASTCFCAAHAQSARLFLPGGDQLGWVIPVPEGASRIEPGFTPTVPIELTFNTWTDFVDDCGQSRVWAGVHFQAAVDASRDMCDAFGDLAHTYLLSLIDGTAPPRPPSMGR